MIMYKENVVRYVVEIDVNKEFKDDFEVSSYIMEMFKWEGMFSEVEKMRKKGWNLRLASVNSFSKIYYVEYVTKIR